MKDPFTMNWHRTLIYACIGIMLTAWALILFLDGPEYQNTKVALFALGVVIYALGIWVIRPDQKKDK